MNLNKVATLCVVVALALAAASCGLTIHTRDSGKPSVKERMREYRTIEARNNYVQCIMEAIAWHNGDPRNRGTSMPQHKCNYIRTANDELQSKLVVTNRAIDETDKALDQALYRTCLMVESLEWEKGGRRHPRPPSKCS